jgi:hypothetical protein
MGFPCAIAVMQSQLQKSKYGIFDFLLIESHNIIVAPNVEVTGAAQPYRAASG